MVNLADREADSYALFQEAAQDADGPALPIRAHRTTQRQGDEEHKPLWDSLPTRGPLMQPNLLGRR